MAGPDPALSREAMLRLAAQLIELASKEAAATPPPAEVPRHEGPGNLLDTSQLVTLSQIAGWVRRSKRTLEKYTSRMPLPTVEGGGGKPAFWVWSEVRPWLEETFRMRLPEQIPDVSRRA